MSKDLFSINDDDSFISKVFNSSSIWDSNELIQYIEPGLRKYMLDVLQIFRKNVVLSRGDSYANKNDYFMLFSRQRRFILLGNVLLRNITEQLMPNISKDLMETISKINPRLRFNYKIYRKLLMHLNKSLLLIPYQKNWLPPFLPSSLWRAGYILKKLNHVAWRLTKGRVGLETTYFNFSEALRYCRKWRKLLVEILFNEESLIYRLGILNCDKIKELVVEHLSRKYDHGEKLAYIITLELMLRKIGKYIA